MKVTMQPENELGILNKGVRFNIKQSNGHVFGYLIVNKGGITWHERYDHRGKKLSWRKLQELLERK